MNIEEFKKHLMKEKHIDLKKCPVEYKGSEDVLEIYLKRNGLNIKYIPNEFKNNKRLALIAMETYDSVLKNVGYTLKADKEIVEKELKVNADAFVNIADNLKNDKKYILKLLEINPKIFKHLKKEFRGDLDVVTKTFTKQKNGKLNNFIDIKWIGQNIADDRSVINNLIDIHGGFFGCAKKYHTDKDLIFKAIKNGFVDIGCLSEEIKSERAFKKLFIESNPKEAYLIPNYQEDKEFVNIIIKVESSIYLMIPPHLKNDLEVAKNLLDNSPKSYTILSEEIKGNIDFLMDYIKKDVNVIKIIPINEKLKEENLIKLKDFYLKYPQEFQVEHNAYMQLERKISLSEKLQSNKDNNRKKI